MKSMGVSGLSMLGIGLGLGLTVAACGRQPAAWSSALHVEGPLRVGSLALWADTTRGKVFAVDPETATVKQVAVARGATFVGTTPAHDALLLLTPGREQVSAGQPAEAPHLSVVTAGSDGRTLAVARVYEIAAPFDHLAVSPDGRTAIAHFTDTSVAEGSAVFRNPNELAIIDLTQPPSATNPVERTIRSLGAAPLGILFSPVLTVAGAPRTLAVVLATDYVTLLDLGHLERGEVTVPLTPPDGTATVTPRQIVFDAATATVYVRADGAVDVFALVLEPRPTTDPHQNDFLPHINQPSAGKIVRDMMLFSDGGKSYVLTVNDSQDLAVIDAATGEFSVVAVGAPVDTVVPIGEPPTEAIVYSRANPQASVTFVTLARLATDGSRNLMRRPVRDLVPVPGGRQLLVVHDDNRTVVSVLDLGPHRADSPILGQVRLASYDFAAGFLVGVAGDLDRLGVLQLDTLNPSNIALEYAPRRVLAVGNHLLVDHGAPGGLVTVVPSPTSKREDTRVVWDFLLDGVLDDQLGG